MKYTREQRLDIGREIYSGESTYVQASEKYDLSTWTLKEYVRLYRETNKLPRMKPGRESAMFKSSEPNTLEEYESMSKEELIEELIKTRIREARLKKGYEVKGDGSVIQYTKKNTK